MSIKEISTLPNQLSAVERRRTWTNVEVEICGWPPRGVYNIVTLDPFFFFYKPQSPEPLFTIFAPNYSPQAGSKHRRNHLTLQSFSFTGQIHDLYFSTRQEMESFTQYYMETLLKVQELIERIVIEDVITPPVLTVYLPPKYDTPYTANCLFQEIDDKFVLLMHLQGRTAKKEPIQFVMHNGINVSTMISEKRVKEFRIDSKLFFNIVDLSDSKVKEVIMVGKSFYEVLTWVFSIYCWSAKAVSKPKAKPVMVNRMNEKSRDYSKPLGPRNVKMQQNIRQSMFVHKTAPIATAKSVPPPQMERREIPAKQTSPVVKFELEEIQVKPKEEEPQPIKVEEEKVEPQPSKPTDTKYPPFQDRIEARKKRINKQKKPEVWTKPTLSASTKLKKIPEKTDIDALKAEYISLLQQEEETESHIKQTIESFVQETLKDLESPPIEDPNEYFDASFEVSSTPYESMFTTELLSLSEHFAAGSQTLYSESQSTLRLAFYVASIFLNGSKNQADSAKFAASINELDIVTVTPDDVNQTASSFAIQLLNKQELIPLLNNIPSMHSWLRENYYPSALLFDTEKVGMIRQGLHQFLKKSVFDIKLPNDLFRHVPPEDRIRFVSIPVSPHLEINCRAKSLKDLRSSFLRQMELGLKGRGGIVSLLEDATKSPPHGDTPVWNEFVSSLKGVKRKLLGGNEIGQIEEWITDAITKKRLHLYFLCIASCKDLMTERYYPETSFIDPFKVRYVFTQLKYVIEGETLDFT